VSITFYAAGRLYRTDWFRFQVQVHSSQLVRLDPVNISARRVRVLESRNRTGSARRELVRDVVPDAAKSDGDAATPAMDAREQ
jgi:hypothetical protein